MAVLIINRPILDISKALLLQRLRGNNILVIIPNIPRYSQFHRRNSGNYLEGVPYKLSLRHHRRHEISNAFLPHLRQVRLRTPIRSVSDASAPCLIVPIELFRVDCASVMVRSVKRAAIRDVLKT
jgi:hypothetical protein